MVTAGFMYQGGVVRLLGHATEALSWLTASADMNCCLVADEATYTPVATSTSYTTIASAMEVDTAAPGYTTGGKTIATVSPAYAADYVVCDAANPAAWTAATFDTQGAVIYDDTVTNKPVVCYLSFGGDKSVTAGTLTVIFDTNGVFRVKVSGF